MQRIFHLQPTQRVSFFESEAKMDEKVEKHPKKMNEQINAPEYTLEDIKKNPQLLASPTSQSALSKSSSGRSNCLCSPTTHVGSFRCRYHRNSSGFSRGGSVGTNLSDLAS